LTPSVATFDPRTGRLTSCDIFKDAAGNNVLPGDRTIDRFGFGIVDTYENPCCCALIAVIDELKDVLIGDDP
jgi:hypothetical protein